MRNALEAPIRPQIADIVSGLKLKPEIRALTWLDRTTKKALPQWMEAFGIIIGNPRFHFTTAAFTFRPTPEMWQRSIINFQQNSWDVVALEDGSMRVKTGYLDNIAKNGLRTMTCVATMPEGENAQLMRSHPRLFFKGVQEIIRRFCKHAIPYKQQALQDVRGLLSNIEVGVIIADESTIVLPKGRNKRVVLSPNNMLHGRTHYVPKGVEPQDILGIAQFPVETEVNCSGDRRPPVFNHEALATDIIIGMRMMMPDMVRNLGARDERIRGVWRAERMANLFRILSWC